MKQRERGRPALPAGQARQPAHWRVAAVTVRLIADESRRTGESAGRIVDRLALHLKDHDGQVQRVGQTGR